MVARDFARATLLSDSRGELPRMRVPALIVQLCRDAIVPVGVGQYRHETKPGSTPGFMGNGGNCPLLSHPAGTSAPVREYLAQC